MLDSPLDLSQLSKRLDIEMSHDALRALLGEPYRTNDKLFWYLRVDGSFLAIEPLDPIERMGATRRSKPMEIVKDVVKIYSSGDINGKIDFTRLVYSAFGTIELNDPRRRVIDENSIIGRLGVIEDQDD